MNGLYEIVYTDVQFWKLQIYLSTFFNFSIYTVNYAQCNALSAYYTALYSVITLHSVYALKGPQYNTSPMKWPV